MTVFFVQIGLELEHELYNGKLSDVKSAMLPDFGAVGGMTIPACIFLLFNYDTATRAGWGVPMFTDIAFSIGILSLLGSRVVSSLKVFLKASAIVDDLGAIIIIAKSFGSNFNLRLVCRSATWQSGHYDERRKEKEIKCFGWSSAIRQNFSIQRKR